MVKSLTQKCVRLLVESYFVNVIFFIEEFLNKIICILMCHFYDFIAVMNLYGSMVSGILNKV